ncbi:MAG TPA: hypothetical protein PKI93_00390 [Alphaproteobacteria bacterium]|nr:hypothetical protein [Alphaproteobacteria bacterium]HNS43790.1 hypothetical protein [Alphaproteobacteria bacterium]
MHQETQGIYVYRPHPLLDRAFLICRKDRNGELSPVGDYAVLDDNEDLHLTEKKLINLVGQMNGEKELISLGNLTGSRLLFHCKPRPEGDPRQEIVFFTYTGQGVSKENAILTLEGVENEN